MNYSLEQLKRFRNEITRFMMMYKFALDELETRIEILKEEFHLLHEYNPIEHTKSRVKSPESIIKKLLRKHSEFSLEGIKRTVMDIAGMRITCSFLSDIYQISEMLEKQRDLRVIDVKDYIKEPKPNGYQSLHMIVEVPVFMSDREEHVCVEIQIRTIAMDFWASLEHKIYYKYNEDVPVHLLKELKEAADSASALDRKMERLHNEVKALKEERADRIDQQLTELIINNEKIPIPAAFLNLLGDGTSTE